MSLERKLRRKKAHQAKKDAEQDIATKITLFGKLGDKCLTCEKRFDKMNKEQVQAWSVVVRDEEEIVRLYCPECWDKAVEIVQNFKEHLENKK
jgi:hypothetical protein